MAYMRGDYYLWDDESGLHIWALDGYDGWDESGWARDEDGRRHPDCQNASGVSIPQSVADEYVVMRLAELVAEDRIFETIDRAVRDQQGNFGCKALQRMADRLKEALEQVA